MSANDLVCGPIKTYKEIEEFLIEPPSWRSLCLELKPHSDYVLRNIDSIGDKSVVFPDIPSFCHTSQDWDGEEKRVMAKNLPKTLVCHDMANGYHDDCSIEGTFKHEAYTFYNWSGVDIFCYFSHHFITIPPLAWINAGHQHGVKVIGTVITEWSDGALIWDEVLKSETEWKKFASSLIAIAKVLKFDGWLLNIENKISNVPALLAFLQYLHTQLHLELTEPVLLWYDSVTSEGLLVWQNGLTLNNKIFFDSCDGIFTNYSWGEDDVAKSVALAGDRTADVYVGVDVWGRNFHGGGEFNTQAAVKIAHSFGCSLAIFAPGWTHEAIPDNPRFRSASEAGLTKYDLFLLRDKALWSSLWPYLNTKLPRYLPFKTSFCRGQGLKRWRYGEEKSLLPWYNLREMQYQPNANLGPHGYKLLVPQPTPAQPQHGVKRNAHDSIKPRQLSPDNGLPQNTQDLTQEGNSAHKTTSLDSDVPEETEDNIHEKNEVDKISKNADVSRKNVELKVHDETVVTKKEDHSVQARVKEIERTKTKYILKPLKELDCLQVYYQDGFHGGSCLRINPQATDLGLIRLFHCDFICQDVLIVCVVTKTLPGHESQYLDIQLSVSDEQNKQTRLILSGGPYPPSQDDMVEDVEYIPPLNETNETKFQRLQKFLLRNEDEFYVPVENPYWWKIRYYEKSLPKHRILSITCKTGLMDEPLLLGHIGLCHKQKDD